MIVLIAILLGIMGTSLMTLYMYLVSFLTHAPLQVDRVLGTMVTFQTNEHKGLSERNIATRTGLITHYLIGVLFSFVFIFLCRHNMLEPTLLKTVAFGFFTGTFGITFWRMLFDMHPNPPAIPENTYLINVWCAHVVFGFGIWISYKLISVLNLDIL